MYYVDIGISKYNLDFFLLLLQYKNFNIKIVCENMTMILSMWNQFDIIYKIHIPFKTCKYQLVWSFKKNFSNLNLSRMIILFNLKHFKIMWIMSNLETYYKSNNTSFSCSHHYSHWKKKNQILDIYAIHRHF